MGGPRWAECRPVFRDLLRACLMESTPHLCSPGAQGFSRFPLTPTETPASLPPGVAVTLWLQGGPASRGRPKKIPCSQSQGFLCDWTYTCSPFLLSLLGTQEPRGTATVRRGPWVQPLCAKVNGPLNCPQETGRSRIPTFLGHVGEGDSHTCYIPSPSLSSAPRRQKTGLSLPSAPTSSLHALHDKVMLCVL